MSPRYNKAIFLIAVFGLAVVIILATAYSVGADPLHPRTRHIWALSLLAAAYCSFRAYTIYKKMAAGKGNSEAFGGVAKLFKKEHAIDRRMAARRERVEAAREKAKENELTGEGSDND